MESQPMLEGAVDVHLHTSPDVVERRYPDLEAARRAEAAGMSGVVLKCHHESTVGRAKAVADATGLDVFGGLVLNDRFGPGLSLEAVETTLALGAKIVWWPTLTSAAHRTYYRSVPTPEPPVDHDLVTAIAAAIAAAGAVFATGHAGPETVHTLATIAAAEGARLLVTHADFWIPDLDPNAQANLASEFPDIWFERCAYICASGTPDPRPVDNVAEAIRQTGGPARNVISSDLGQPGLPPWPQGLADFGGELVLAGIARDDVRSMLSASPKALLSL